MVWLEFMNQTENWQNRSDERNYNCHGLKEKDPSIDTFKYLWVGNIHSIIFIILTIYNYVTDVNEIPFSPLHT